MATHQTPIGQFQTIAPDQFSGGAHLSDEEDDGLAALLIRQTAKRRGVIPSARLPFSAVPANADSVTIGGQVFEFVTTLGVASTSTQVKVLGTAALALTSLVNAINGIADVNVMPATTLFAGLVTADDTVSATLRLRSSTERGNGKLAEVAAPSTALAAAITSGGAWDRADLDTTGSPLEKQNFAVISFTVTAAMVTAGTLPVELGFAPSVVIAPSAKQAAFAVSGTTVVITMTANFAANDVVRAVAYE